MKIIAHDPRTGLLRLRLETPSDAWRLSRLVATGDRVGALTTRRDSEAPADTPSAQRDRRTVFLTIEAQRVEFHEFTHHIRITGPIVEGPFDLGRHHTLDLTVGDEVALTKPTLAPSDQIILEEGQSGRLEPLLLILCADWSEAALVRLEGRHLSIVDEFSRSGSGKHSGVRAATRDRERSDYLERLLNLVKPEVERAATLVLTGPGFLKEELARLIPDRIPATRGKIRVFPSSVAGLAGVHEVLRSGRAEEVLGESMAAQEAKAVERLVQALGTRDMTALGPSSVEVALDAGAVESLLVLEDLLRDPSVGRALETATRQRTHVLIVRRGGEAGSRLMGLGGIAAILRYPWRNPGS